MPDISVQQSTFERLQQHAKPFVDTPEMVVIRALDALDRITDRPAPSTTPSSMLERTIDSRVLPNLTHTKVLEASISGIPISKPNWNSILDEMLHRAMKSAGTFKKLQTICPVNMAKGRKVDEGYSYLPDIDVSVQGQDANAACRAIVTAAQGIGVSLDIVFMWRHKNAAAHPGERARLTIAASKASASGHAA